MAREENFEEALRILTRAYIVDPLNKELLESETAIRSEFEAYLGMKETERKREDERRRQQEEEQLRRMEEDERQRLMEQERNETEQKVRENKERIQQYLARARQYVEERQFENALGEIALAFVVDPFDDDVKEMEAAVHDARRHAKPAQPVSTNDALQGDEELRQRVRDHQEHAKHLRSSGDFNAALEEIAKAFALDPLNEETKVLEADIDREYRQQIASRSAQRASGEDAGATTIIPPPATPESASVELREAILRHVARARDFVGRNALDDALKEVHRGLGRAPEDRELLRLKADLGVKMQQRKVSTEREQGQAIHRHAERARELITKHDYEEALAEIALGLTLSADDADLKLLEQSAWEKKESEYRQNNSSTTRDAQEAITFILRRARELQETNEFAKALDEIAKAYVLDPVNKEVRKAEIEIRQAELRLGNQEESSLKLIYPDRPSSGRMS
jgi:trichohyalin